MLITVAVTIVVATTVGSITITIISFMLADYSLMRIASALPSPNATTTKASIAATCHTYGACFAFLPAAVLSHYSYHDYAIGTWPCGFIHGVAIKQMTCHCEYQQELDLSTALNASSALARIIRSQCSNSARPPSLLARLDTSKAVSLSI